MKCSSCEGKGYLKRKVNFEEVICQKCNGTGGFTRSKCQICIKESMVQQIKREIYIPPGSINMLVIPGYGH